MAETGQPEQTDTQKETAKPQETDAPSETITPAEQKKEPLAEGEQVSKKGVVFQSNGKGNASVTVVGFVNKNTVPGRKNY